MTSRGRAVALKVALASDLRPSSGRHEHVAQAAQGQAQGQEGGEEKERAKSLG
jgi:hypothetical protein